MHTFVKLDPAFKVVFRLGLFFFKLFSSHFFCTYTSRNWKKHGPINSQSPSDFTPPMPSMLRLLPIVKGGAGVVLWVPFRCPWDWPGLMHSTRGVLFTGQHKSTLALGNTYSQACLQLICQCLKWQCNLNLRAPSWIWAANFMNFQVLNA